MFSKWNVISHFCRICFSYYFKGLLGSFKLAKNVFKIFHFIFSSTAISSKLPFLYDINWHSILAQTYKEVGVSFLEG